MTNVVNVIYRITASANSSARIVSGITCESVVVSCPATGSSCPHSWRDSTTSSHAASSPSSTSRSWSSSSQVILLT